MRTVLPSLGASGADLPVDSEFYQTFARHARMVEFVLRSARQIGHVAIVTLAQCPWVLTSADRFLPNLDLSALLQELQIDVYYAREYVPPLQPEIHQWEVMLDRSQGKLGIEVDPLEDGALLVRAVLPGGLTAAKGQADPTNAISPGDRIVAVNGVRQELVAECRKTPLLTFVVSRELIDMQPYTAAKQKGMSTCLARIRGRGPLRHNVISIGDSEVEQKALKDLLLNQNDGWPGKHSFCKTVNFLDMPNLENLSNQLKILMVWLPRLVQHEGHFDLTMAEIATGHIGNPDELERKLLAG